MTIPPRNSRFIEQFPILSMILALLAIACLAGCAMAPVRPGVAPYGEADFPKSTVTPRWNALLSAEEADIFRLVPGGRMLVGTQDLGGSFFWAPSENDLALFDLTDGKRLWTADRKEVLRDLSDIILVSPVILADTRRGYTALSLDNGAVLWSWKPEIPVMYATAGSNTAVFWREAGNGLAKFTARSLKTGAEAWSAEVKGAAIKDRSTRASVWGEKIFIVNEEIAMLDAADGIVRWQVRSPVGHGENTALSERHIAVFGVGGLAFLEAVTGKSLWKAEGAPIPTMASIRGEMVLTAASAGGDAWTLASYQNGSRAWSFRLDNLPESAMVFDDAGRLCFLAKGSIWCVDTTSGGVVFTSVLPPYLTQTRSLPPKLEVREERAIVAGEHGVAAYSTKTGKLLYDHFVEGAELFTHAYARRSMAMRGIPGGLKYDEVHVPMQQYTPSSSYYSAVQNYVNYIDGQTRSVLESRTSTASDRLNAMNYNIAVQQFAMAYEQAIAHIQLAVAQTMLGISMYRSAVAWRQANIVQRDGLYRLMLKKADHSLNDSLQWGYYLRPWFREGWGVTAVDLATGKRADIRHSPYSEPLLIGSAQLPAIAIDPVNRRLLVKGLGLDRTKYVLYQKNALSLEMPFFPYQWDIPHPSILAYDLDGMTFDSTERYAFTPRPGFNDKDRALVEAILEKNEEKVEAAIKAGANVNARDEYGATPVFYSALTDDKGINRLLLANGADPVACDIGGQTPYTWTVYSIPVPKGAVPVIHANNARVEELYGAIEMEKRHRACMKKWGRQK